MNNLTPAALDLAAKFDDLPVHLQETFTRIIGAAATLPPEQVAELIAEPDEGEDAAADDDVETKPLDPVAGAERCADILDTLAMLRREVRDQPEDDGDPDRTLARFRRIHSMVMEPLEECFEVLHLFNGGAIQELYAGHLALAGMVANPTCYVVKEPRDSEHAEDELENVRATLAMASSAMELRTRKLLREITGVRQ